jgi:glycosyltransferase involved in cell wall biosynthesis
MNDPLISVVTICLNCEPLIAATMRSVLDQTYKRLEYVVVDGLSSDGTVDAARRIAAEYPDRVVRIFSERDAGISDAMNRGVVRSSGELIAHLNAGDRYVDESVIERVIESYSLERWRWAMGIAIVVDCSGTTRHIYRPSADLLTLRKKNFVPHQSTFLVRDIFDRHGLFRTDYPQAMDYEYWVRIAFKGGEQHHLLPFVTTYFLDGGRSAAVSQLVRYLWRVRRLMREYGCPTTNFEDLRFVARVIAFAGYYRARKMLGLSVASATPQAEAGGSDA